MVADEDAALLSALKAKRRALAEAQGVPAYVVFPDRTLIEMAERRPMTLDAMAGITGVGAKKLESYAPQFLAVIIGAAPPATHPARRRLAGRDAGEVYDRLAADPVAPAAGRGRHRQAAVAVARPAAPDRRGRGLLRCPTSTGRVISGPAKLDRFGAAFLDVLSGG